MAEFWTTFAAADLAASETFYRALGFEVRPAPPGAPCFTIHPAGATICIFTREFFAQQVFGASADPTTTQEVVQSLSVADRAEVDRLLAAAREAGAREVRPGVDLPFGYGGGFADLDGHVWAVLHFGQPEACTDFGQPPA